MYVAYASLAALAVLAACTAVLQARTMQLAKAFPPIYIQVRSLLLTCLTLVTL